MKIEGIDQSQLKLAFQSIKGVNIPSVPKTLLALQQELNKQEPDQQKIINLISEDISLSGKILKNINSAAFGLNAKVSSIEHATVILGVRNLRDMIVASALSKALEDTLPGFLDISEYSSRVGMTARLIANDCRLPDPESAFIVGLFHKSGTMMLMQKFNDYMQIYDQYQTDPDALTNKELELFGSTYPIVSFILAYHWKLSVHVAQAIALHLSKVDSIKQDDIRSLVAAVQVATYLVQSTADNYTESKSSLAMRQMAMSALNIDDNLLSELSAKAIAI